MSIHSIYNPALEHHEPFNRSVTERLMTPEEMARFGVTEFKPARDTEGKVIKAPSFTPFKTSENVKSRVGDVNCARNNKKFKHITKGFTLAEMATGKTIAEIEIEQGMTKYFLLKKCRAWGIAPPKKLRGEGFK